jgi:hypothetical protein
VVARAEQVDVLLLQDVEGVFALGLGAVVEPIAFDAVARVDEEEVAAIDVGFGAEVVGEGDVVAPVGGEGRSAGSSSQYTSTSNWVWEWRRRTLASARRTSRARLWCVECSAATTVVRVRALRLQVGLLVVWRRRAVLVNIGGRV